MLFAVLLMKSTSHFAVGHVCAILLLFASAVTAHSQAYVYTFHGINAQSELDDSYVILSNAVAGPPAAADLVQAKILDSFNAYGTQSEFIVSVPASGFHITSFGPNGFIGSISGSSQSYIPGTTVTLQRTSAVPDWCILASNNGFFPGNPSGEGAFGYWSAAPLLTWQKSNVPATNCCCVVCSADGSRMAAAATNGGIFVSTDFGATWNATSAPSNQWTALTISADASTLAAADNTYLYVSSDLGTNWVINAVPGTGNWRGLACSADGTKLIAAAEGYDLYYPFGEIVLSTDFGQTWRQMGPDEPWAGVTCSADGTHIVAWWGFFFYEGLFTSSDGGTTWLRTTNQVVTSVAGSVDASQLVATGPFGVMTSRDFGSTWSPISAPVTNTTSAAASIASSADGSTLIAASGSGSIYTSFDSGVTWLSNNLPVCDWSAVACSADGARLVAATKGGGIYTAQTTPQLSLTIGRASDRQLLLSWIIPSRPFSVQHSADLLVNSWNDLTNTPSLNLTNLHHQIVLPPSTGFGFYRLSSKNSVAQ
jgi:hypothetical protein